MIKRVDKELYYQKKGRVNDFFVVVVVYARVSFFFSIRFLSLYSRKYAFDAVK